MNALRVPVIVFGVLALGFFVLVGTSGPLLPARVASHFTEAGQPDGWMTRGSYLSITSIQGIGMPLLMLAILYAARFAPNWAVSIPNKRYYLQPGTRTRTFNLLLQHGFWLASLMLLLTGTLHVMTIIANRSAPVRLPGPAFFVVMGGFLLGVAVWVVALYRMFRRPV